MSFYLRFDGAALPGAVGKDGPNGSRVSDGHAGHLCFGPYFSIEPGAYVAGFYMRALPGSVSNLINCDVFAAGKGVIASKSVSSATLFDDTPTLVSMDFDLDIGLDDVEIRTYVYRGVLLEIAELVVFSKRPRDWSGK